MIIIYDNFMTILFLFVRMVQGSSGSFLKQIKLIAIVNRIFHSLSVLCFIIVLPKRILEFYDHLLYRLNMV